jgi:hypothetical protein
MLSGCFNLSRVFLKASTSSQKENKKKGFEWKKKGAFSQDFKTAFDKFRHKVALKRRFRWLSNERNQIRGK